jgi:hypothetical protein
VDQSFNDIRSAVRDALSSADKDKGADLMICDLGPDWVVYQDPDTVGAGMQKRSYQINSDGSVRFTSDPVAVTKQTSYPSQSTQAKTFAEASVKVREHFRRVRNEKSPGPDSGTAT